MVVVVVVMVLVELVDGLLNLGLDSSSRYSFTESTGSSISSPLLVEKQKYFCTDYTQQKILLNTQLCNVNQLPTCCGVTCNCYLSTIQSAQAEIFCKPAAQTDSNLHRGELKFFRIPIFLELCTHIWPYSVKMCVLAVKVKAVKPVTLLLSP